MYSLCNGGLVEDNFLQTTSVVKGPNLFITKRKNRQGTEHKNDSYFSSIYNHKYKKHEAQLCFSPRVNHRNDSIIENDNDYLVSSSHHRILRTEEYDEPRVSNELENIEESKRISNDLTLDCDGIEITNFNSSLNANTSVVTEFSPTNMETIDKVGMNDNPPVTILSDMRRKNLNRIIIGHLNINHLAGKFENLKQIIKDSLDILVLTESKTDGSFPVSQFLIEGFSPPFRQDRDINGGGVFIYVSDMISCKQVELVSRPEDFEGIS